MPPRTHNPPGQVTNPVLLLILNAITAVLFAMTSGVHVGRGNKMMAWLSGLAALCFFVAVVFRALTLGSP